MKSWRHNNLLNVEEEIKGFSEPFVSSQKLFSTDEKLPDDIISWTGRLELLYGIPFSNLVPHQDVLPKESIRFFQIDDNWIYSLIEGALSLGRVTATDKFHDSYFGSLIHRQKSQFRKTFRKVSKHDVHEKLDERDEGVPITGFLLRSILIEGWPGLEVKAYSKEKKQLHLLRLDKLSSNVLICLFEGTIDEISFQEPPETLHFGVDNSNSSPTLFAKDLKYLRHQDNKNPGDPIEHASVKSIPFRDKNSRVIDISSLAKDLRQALIAVKAWDETLPFTSAEFALQMVEGIQKISFISAPLKLL